MEFCFCLLWLPSYNEKKSINHRIIFFCCFCLQLSYGDQTLILKTFFTILTTTIKLELYTIYVVMYSFSLNVLKFLKVFIKFRTRCVQRKSKIIKKLKHCFDMRSEFQNNYTTFVFPLHFLSIHTTKLLNYRANQFLKEFFVSYPKTIEIGNLNIITFIRKINRKA